MRKHFENIKDFALKEIRKSPFFWISVFVLFAIVVEIGFEISPFVSTIIQWIFNLGLTAAIISLVH